MSRNLTFEEVQQRDGRRAIVDLKVKGGRVPHIEGGRRQAVAFQAHTSLAHKLCLSATALMLLVSCGPTREPVTLNYPHGWSFRPDEIARRTSLSDQFTRETGIQVKHIPTPESAFDQLDLSRKLLQQGSSGADLLGVDLIWSAILEPDLIDMQPLLGG